MFGDEEHVGGGQLRITRVVGDLDVDKEHFTGGAIEGDQKPLGLVRLQRVRDFARSRMGPVYRGVESNTRPMETSARAAWASAQTARFV